MTLNDAASISTSKGINREISELGITTLMLKFQGHTRQGYWV